MSPTRLFLLLAFIGHSLCHTHFRKPLRSSSATPVAASELHEILVPHFASRFLGEIQQSIPRRQETGAWRKEGRTSNRSQLADALESSWFEHQRLQNANVMLVSGQPDKRFDQPMPSILKDVASRLLDRYERGVVLFDFPPSDGNLTVAMIWVLSSPHWTHYQIQFVNLALPKEEAFWSSIGGLTDITVLEAPNSPSLFLDMLTEAQWTEITECALGQLASPQDFETSEADL